MIFTKFDCRAFLENQNRGTSVATVATPATNPRRPIRTVARVATVAAPHPQNQNLVEAGWAAEDWLAFFNERAAIIQYDGGEERMQAEFQAFLCCIARWQELHPGTSRRDAAKLLIALGLPPAGASPQ